MMDETKKLRLEELEKASSERVLSAEETEELNALRSEAGLNSATSGTDEASAQVQTEAPATPETPASEAPASVEAKPADEAAV